MVERINKEENMSQTITFIYAEKLLRVQTNSERDRESIHCCHSLAQLVVVSKGCEIDVKLRDDLQELQNGEARRRLPMSVLLQIHYENEKGSIYELLAVGGNSS
jgi:hypothetical protein